MTPKEKAQSLIKKHLTSISEESMDSDNILLYSATQCAIISTNEMIKELANLPPIPYNEKRVIFWHNVKKEFFKPKN